MVRTERQDAIVIWTVDRAETKNALDHATMDRLTDAIQEARDDASVRAAVLTGAGHMFVSGGDLRELRDRSTPQDAERLTDAGFELCRAIGEAPFPVIAALPGPAIGGGAELALACDLRVASERATMQLKHVRMGATPAWGTTERLVRLAGPAVAARLLYLAEPLRAPDAFAAGLVDRVVSDGTAEEEALAWARAVAQGAPEAVRHCKELIQLAASASAAMALEERARFIATWSSDAHSAAVDAFFEGRAPEFEPARRR